MGEEDKADATVVSSTMPHFQSHRSILTPRQVNRRCRVHFLASLYGQILEQHYATLSVSQIHTDTETSEQRM